jgi:glycerophosphoryl diester phosphodiesterase
VEIIGHRGASFDAPENTLASVRLAWAQGADAVEIDVHLSRDGRLVAIHDASTRRTARVNRKVARQTLAQLRALDVGRWKGVQWAGEKIPTLEEVLASIPPGRRLFIEVKSRADAAPELANALSRCQCPPGQVVFISFSLPLLRSLKRSFPNIEVCWISELKRSWRTRRRPSASMLIHKIKTAGVDGLDLKARKSITPGFVKTIHEAGLKLYVWTVDSPAVAKMLARAGVDGLTTNRPGWLREKIAAC